MAGGAACCSVCDRHARSLPGATGLIADRGRRDALLPGEATAGGVRSRGAADPPGAERQRYFAAITMISTSAFGSASFASTQARAGRFFGSTQAVQTSFIGARLRMSVTQMVADRTFDLLLPHLASRRSISSTISLVCPFTSLFRSFATIPAR